ncbi:TPA: hypothetical protein ACKQJM_003194 [Serratia marcescens]
MNDTGAKLEHHYAKREALQENHQNLGTFWLALGTDCDFHLYAIAVIFVTLEDLAEKGSLRITA